MDFIEARVNRFRQDLAFGIRSLRKDYALTLTAVFTLAIAIGANSSIASLINAVLLRPLPYKNPDRIVRLWESQGAWTGSVSWPNLEDWRQQNSSFEALAAISFPDLTLRRSPTPLHLTGAAVSWDFFKVLGVQPLLGRVFLPGEDQPGTGNLVILSEGVWRDQFGSDPNVIGQSVTVEGVPHTILAVMPASVRFPSVDTQAWIPLVVLPVFANDRTDHRYEVIGRLKPQVSLDQAQREMTLIARRIEQQYPAMQVGRSVFIQGLQEQLVGYIRPALLALFVAVVFVLLIACANVANLLLARSTTRRRETAIRTALGATRGQLLRQFVTESMLIAVIGGSIGIALSKLAMTALVAWAGPHLPRAQEVKLDGRVLLFSVALSLLTGLLCGIVPGLQSSKSDIQMALKQGGTSAGSPQSNLTAGLLAAGEVAAAIVLLVGAGLLMKTVLELQDVDPGFRAENVLTMKMALPQESYKPDAAARFYDELRHRVMQLPGVQSIGLINLLPMQEWGYNSELHVEGLPKFVNNTAWAIEVRFVSPGYFHALNIPLVRGRDFSENDLGRPERFALANQKYAEMISQYEDPLGQHIVLSDDPKAAITIVGVVGNVRQSGLDQPVRPEVYFLSDVSPAELGSPNLNYMNIVVRTDGDPSALAAAVRHEVVSLDANQTVYDVKTMQTAVDNSMASRRFVENLILIFAILGTTLAVGGVYSVLSYLVAQHTREIAIRLALGAQHFQVVGLVLKQGAIVGFVGLLIGVAAAFALTRLLSALLVDVKTYDALTFVGASSLLFCVVIIASYLAARQTAGVDPMIALRQD
jgi:putative ABC transport system permease protein